MAKQQYLKCKVSDIAAPIKNALVGGPFGSNLVSRDYHSFGIPVIRGQNLGFGRWIGGEFVFVSQKKADELSSNIARPCDLVFTQRGTIGQVAIVPREPYRQYVISQSQMKLTVDETKADVLFLYYLFNTHKQQEYIKQNAIQTGVPHTNLEHLRNTPIQLPLLLEQKNIAYILGTLDNQIELNRKMNETLEAMAQAIFKSWFVDFDPVRAKMEGKQLAGMDAETAALFPSEFEMVNGREVPEGWKVGTLGESTTIVGGSTPSTINPEYWNEGTHSFASPKDLAPLLTPILLETDKKITDRGVDQISSRVLPIGTLLLSSRAPIGYLAITTIPVSINQGFIAIICDKILPNYYILLWVRENMPSIIDRANGTTFLEISKSNFKPMEIIIPSDDVLEKFIRLVKQLFSEIENNEQQSSTLAKIRDTLLPKLMSGEINIGTEEGG